MSGNHDASITCDGTSRPNNYGNLATLVVGNLPQHSSYEWSFLIRFNVSGSSYPSNPTSARLRLYKCASGTSESYTMTLSAYRVTEAWDEATVRWDDRPNVASSSSGSSASFGWTGASNGEYVDIDITSLYRSWKSNAGSNYGVAIKPTAATGGGGWYQLPFHSMESDIASYRPVLITQ